MMCPPMGGTGRCDTLHRVVCTMGYKNGKIDNGQVLMEAQIYGESTSGIRYVVKYL